MNKLMSGGTHSCLTAAHWVPFFLTFSLSTILNIPLISLLLFFLSLSLSKIFTSQLFQSAFFDSIRGFSSTHQNHKKVPSFTHFAAPGSLHFQLHELPFLAQT
ncbi:hypothetical protein VNO77_20740 [Canavalia gladiata]|uniref:Uncharacterized protein n=1 Tax=Canavalia gladiata TaxID=3824 RepID=A0AAN9LTP0_CANGL